MGFPVLSLRQSRPSRKFLRLRQRRKDALFQRALREALSTELSPSCPEFLSPRPFSLRSGYCANLVLTLGFLPNQSVNGGPRPVEFESAIGSRQEPGSNSIDDKRPARTISLARGDQPSPAEAFQEARFSRVSDTYLLDAPVEVNSGPGTFGEGAQIGQ